MKHPYAYYLKQYMEFLKGHYAEITLVVRERRLNQYKKIIYQLREEKKISATSPRLLKPKDIAVIIGHRKQAGIAAETLQDDISFLNGFFKFCGNKAVEKFKEEYPRFVPKVFKKRKECLSDEKMDAIIKHVYEHGPSSFIKMRSCAIVVFSMCGGLRTLEVQNAKVGSLNRTEKGYVLRLDVVKGVDSYGQMRYVNILPRCTDFVDRYLEMRAAHLKENNIISDFLIPSLDEGVYVMSDKNVRKLKDHVCDDIGFKFNLQILRRTYAQYLTDEGVPLDQTQVVMGHSNPNTTYRNYAGIRPERVTDLIFDRLAENAKNSQK